MNAIIRRPRDLVTLGVALLASPVLAGVSVEDALREVRQQAVVERGGADGGPPGGRGRGRGQGSGPDCGRWP